eukprot:TRINITY_DN10356_c0_g1_i2.p1 TRINITY_DN10356_c0_g1~~TRINITY_DN10356_c0_g1_i2.p1  ORF type:complete len:437 (-),score=74.73 TRINITY_DN10356_c0_g1_i2:63-1373(-)
MAQQNVLLQNLQSILQQSVAQLSQQGQASIQPPQTASPDNSASSVVAGLLSGLVGALGNNNSQQQPEAQGQGVFGLTQQTEPDPYSPEQHSSQFPADFDGPLPSVEEFVAANGLEGWCAEALYLLNPEQQARVMMNPLNLQNTTNLNGVLTSRIKEVAPVDQRLQMFITLNGLADGVVDRLSTLTPEQHEKVMESTLKIQKANNPSGVAMKRITDVLRHDRLGIAHGPHLSSPTYGSPHHSAGVQRPALQASATSVLTSLVESLSCVAMRGGGHGHGPYSRARSRSRGRRHSSAAPIMGGSVPNDIQSFLTDYRLDWWVGEVLTRLSLYQRQNVMQELANMRDVKNPSGVIMTRVRKVANTQELLTIFIDINNIDRSVAEDLWGLTEDQQVACMAAGIYVQNARSPSVAVRSRIRNVLAGNDAMGGTRKGGANGMP